MSALSGLSFQPPAPVKRAGTPLAEGRRGDLLAFGERGDGREYRDVAHALAFMEKNHDQVRKGTSLPYYIHPLKVASVLMEYLPAPLPGTEDLIELPSAEFPNGITRKEAYFASLFHDLVEDSGGAEMAEKIRLKFGDTVTKLVLYCSDAKNEERLKLPYNQRKREYLQKIANGPATALLLAACDKLSNLETSCIELRHPVHLQEGQSFWDKFGPSRNEKLRYYRDAIDIFRATGKHPAVVNALETRYRELMRLVAESRRPAWLNTIIRWFSKLTDLVKLFAAPRVPVAPIQHKGGVFGFSA